MPATVKGKSCASQNWRDLSKFRRFPGLVATGRRNFTGQCGKILH